MLQQMSGFPCTLWLNNIPLYVFTTTSLSFIHQWTLRFSRLGSALVNKATMNMGCRYLFVGAFVTIWIYSQRVSLVPQTIRYMPEMQATSVRSLGQEDHLYKGRATHSSNLA